MSDRNHIHAFTHLCKLPGIMPGPARPPFYSTRISHTTTPKQKRALDLARVDDGIEATARLRAMTQLWIDDPRIRKRVDKLARDLR